MSCEKLVEVDYPSNQIGTTQVFDDINTANAALGSLYAGLRDKSIISGNNYGAGGPLLATYADELDCYYNDQNGYLDIYHNQLHETNTVVASTWQTAYKLIYYANSIIDGVENSTALSDTDKNRIKGEALLIRSLIYFYLQQIFGNIPYTTSLDYEYNRTISKTEAGAVLEQIETDVKEASSLLTNDYQNTERIYLNRKAAQLLLARIFLIKSEWSQAEMMSDSILLSPLYHFQTNINDVFHNSGTHILWQLKPQSSGNPTKEASFYYFSGAAPNAYALTTDLVNSFSDVDLRKQTWMAQVTFNGNSWYRAYKYKNRSNNTNEYSIVFRLEEVYFIKAEALARQNRFDEALPYLNATRVRAGLTAFTSLSSDSFYNELLAEKRREFFTEFGLRFLDLKRMGRLSDIITLKPSWEDYKQVWPIPKSEILMDQNLLPQNIGY
jgi:hypothetical protein